MDNETEKNNISYYKYSEKGLKTRNYELWDLICSNFQFDISFKEKFYLYENKLNNPPKWIFKN